MFRNLPRFAPALAVALVFLASTARAGETLEDVEKKLIELNAKIKTLSARITSGYEISDGGKKNVSATRGTYEFAIFNNTQYTRTDTRTTRTIVAPGKNATIESAKLEVSDGNATFVLEEIPGDKFVTKTPVTLRPANPLQSLREKFAIVLLPDESIDGQPCWVIEAQPRKDLPAMKAGNRSRHWYRKSDGVLAKSEFYSGDGAIALARSYHDIKVNAPIAPERFTFTPPADAKIYDVVDAKPPAPGEK